ncbi:MAG: WD40 repeat domain-containing protein, partial [Verrucomicrobiaceae bacterium]
MAQWILLSPDAQFLAVHLKNEPGDLLVWDTAAKELILRTTVLRVMQISPDSRMIAVSTPQGVNLTSLTKGGSTRFLRTGHPVAETAFSPDSRRIALLPDSGDKVEIWDAASGELQESFAVNAGACQLAWHPDGAHLMIGGILGHYEMRTLTTGWNRVPAEAGLAFRGHVARIFTITLTPDGATAISQSWDQSSIAWDLVSGRPLLREYRMSILGINPEGNRVIVRKQHPATITESVAALLPRTGYRTMAWAGEARSPEAVFTSPDGRLGVVSYNSAIPDNEGDCILWDFRTGAEAARVKGVWAQFSADSRTMFTFERYAANRVRSYDVSRETLAAPPADWGGGKVIYQGLPGEAVNTGTMGPDGRTLVVAATDAVIFLDTLTGQTTR